jgi:hypothetical protein
MPGSLIQYLNFTHGQYPSNNHYNKYTIVKKQSKKSKRRMNALKSLDYLNIRFCVPDQSESSCPHC